MTSSGNSSQAPAISPGRGHSYRRSALGLGPLEAAVMRVLWGASKWVRIQDICDLLDYHRVVSYTTVATVTGILCHKGLAVRQEGDNAGHPGTPPWWYRPARSQDEHIGELIAALLAYSPSPTTALDPALTLTATPHTTPGTAATA